MKAGNASENAWFNCCLSDGGAPLEFDILATLPLPYLLIFCKFNILHRAGGAAEGCAHDRLSPSWQAIGKLGAIAVIRTALNYFLGREMQEEGPKPAAPVRPPLESVAPAGAEYGRVVD